MRSRLRGVSLRVATSLVAITCPFTAPLAATEYESRIVDLAAQVERGHVDRALVAARALVQEFPGSRLGRLIYADLLVARSGRLPAVGGGTLQGGRELEDLRHELRARWHHATDDSDRLDTHLPDTLLQVSPRSEYVVFADLSRSRLFVYSNDQGRLRLTRNFYVTQGFNGSGKQVEGDQRTPVGVYYVTGFIDGATLPSRYGPGALPISYPNAMDRRRQRTGYGIWIHGTEPFLINRAPLASDGCLSLNNDDFLLLNRTLARPRHTPVIIDESARWVRRDSLREKRESLLLAIESWRRDWVSGDPDRYLSHYDRKRFSDGKRNFLHWAARKRAILGAKQRIRVEIDDIELFGYPGEEHVVLADFSQRFESDTFDAVMRKQQYWKLGDDGTWRIMFEGTSQKSPPRVIAEEESADREESSDS